MGKPCRPYLIASKTLLQQRRETYNLFAILGISFSDRAILIHKIKISYQT